MIGTCVVVIAISEGAVVARFTRTPDALYSAAHERVSAATAALVAP